MMGLIHSIHLRHLVSEVQGSDHKVQEASGVTCSVKQRGLQPGAGVTWEGRPFQEPWRQEAPRAQVQEPQREREEGQLQTPGKEEVLFVKQAPEGPGKPQLAPDSLIKHRERPLKNVMTVGWKPSSGRESREAGGSENPEKDNLDN